LSETYNPDGSQPPRATIPVQSGAKPLELGYNTLAQFGVSNVYNIVAGNLNTAFPLSASDMHCRSITLLADPTNAGIIFVGDSNPTFPLVAGAGLTLEICNMYNVFILGNTVGDIVHTITELF